MAKAPNSSTNKKTTRSKAAPKAGAKIEDAEVIEETPPKTAEPKTQSKPKTPPEKPATPQPNTKGEESKPVSPKPKSIDEPKPETKRSEPAAKPDSPPPSPAKPARKSGGAGAFVGLLLGGVAAAAIGFVAARYIVPDGWPFPGVPPKEDPVAAAVAAQGTQITGLGGRIDALSTSVGALESDTGLDNFTVEVTTRLDSIGSDIAGVKSQLDEIDIRLTAVEKLAPEGSAAAQTAAKAYERELVALREMFQSELEKIEAAQGDASQLQEQAAQAAKSAAGRAALARVTAALDNGQPFADALQDLTANTGIEAPGALKDAAADGVPTLSTLQDAYPAAARAALDAAVRAGVEAGEVSRFTAFLQTQLGTRSLEPKEGADADAVLSRVEAALKQGDLGAALIELDALPEAGQPAMADWRATVEARKAALDANAGLAQQLNAK